MVGLHVTILYTYHQISETIHFFLLVAGTGFEPVILAYETKLVTITINPHNWSDRWKLNPHLQSHSLICYHYNTALCGDAGESNSGS